MCDTNNLLDNAIDNNINNPINISNDNTDTDNIISDTEIICYICFEKIKIDNIDIPDNIDTSNKILCINELDCECKDIYFHDKCFNKWYNKNKSCPICRKSFQIHICNRHIIQNTNTNIKIICGCIISVVIIICMLYLIYIIENSDIIYNSTLIHNKKNRYDDDIIINM